MEREENTFDIDRYIDDYIDAENDEIYKQMIGININNWEMKPFYIINRKELYCKQKRHCKEHSILNNHS